MVLVHRLQCIGIRGFDTAENGDKERLPHLLQNLGAFGDVKRRLAGKPQDVTGRLLPFDQMWQQIQSRLSVADEIVVDKIHRAGDPTFEQLVQFGDDLLRGLQPGIAAIKARDIAEFALVGTAA